MFLLVIVSCLLPRPFQIYLLFFLPSKLPWLSISCCLSLLYSHLSSLLFFVISYIPSITLSVYLLFPFPLSHLTLVQLLFLFRFLVRSCVCPQLICLFICFSLPFLRYRLHLSLSPFTCILAVFTILLSIFVRYPYMFAFLFSFMVCFPHFVSLLGSSSLFTIPFPVLSPIITLALWATFLFFRGDNCIPASNNGRHTA